MACRDQPATCRGRIAERLRLTASKRKPWQYEGRCPACRHGGFAITAGDQGHNPPRHVWHCNCHRCRCDPATIREAMLRLGIPVGCLGSYKQRSRTGPPISETSQLRSAMLDVLTDAKIVAPADLKLRMLEVIDGKAAPADWDGFLAFAERAGVQRSKRYTAAARWGRGRRQQQS